MFSISQHVPTNNHTHIHTCKRMHNRKLRQLIRRVASRIAASILVAKLKPVVTE